MTHVDVAGWCSCKGHGTAVRPRRCVDVATAVAGAVEVAVSAVTPSRAAAAAQPQSVTIAKPDASSGTVQQRYPVAAQAAAAASWPVAGTCG